MEAVTVVRYASFWKRFWALSLDLLLIQLVAGVVTLLTEGARSAPAITLLFAIVYFVGLGMEGGTVGKRMLGLRLVREDGHRLAFGQAILRELIGKSISAAVFLLGFLWAAWDARRQGWHDRIARTYVVEEAMPVALPNWASDPPWRSSEQYGRTAESPGGETEAFKGQVPAGKR